MKKRYLSSLLVVSLTFMMFSQQLLFPVKAESTTEKPAKPVISVSEESDGTAVRITISPTERAEGYLIYMKSESDEKYKKIKTLKKDGTAKRTYTVKDLEDGTYSFKVKSYLKTDSATIKSAYSKVKSITIEAPEDDEETNIVPVEVTVQNFPDKNFRKYLLEEIDKDKDKILSVEEIEVTANLFLDNREIKDLTGIEFFPTVGAILCRNNKLTSIDLSKNYGLMSIACENNMLAELDVSQNKELCLLYCDNNRITTLDIRNNSKLNAVSCKNNQITDIIVGNDYPNMELFYCYNNQIQTDIDLSGLPKLRKVYCYGNQIKKLDVSNCPRLQDVMCNQNQLTELNVANCPNLTDLIVQQNQLQSLDLSSFSNLTILGCWQNQLTVLDVSNNPVLEDLACGENQLTELDLSNNTGLKTLSCNACQITSLDLSHNTALESLACGLNLLTRAGCK